MAADSILQDALDLPLAERARLVRVLSESIEAARETLSESEWLEAWGPVFSGRADGLESGAAKPIDFRAAVAALRKSPRSSRSR